MFAMHAHTQKNNNNNTSTLTMGKDNRNRQRNKLNLRNSANPAGLVSASDIRKLRELDAEALSAGNSPAISMNENDGTTQTNIPRLVRELDSIHDFTRENACVALAGIVLSGSDDNDGGGGDNDDDDDALMTDRQRDLVQRVNSQLSHNDVIRLVLERGAAHKLSQKLCDPSCAVRIAAAGALRYCNNIYLWNELHVHTLTYLYCRNLSIVGGYELCQRLQQDDIIMLIMAAMKKVRELSWVQCLSVHIAHLCICCSGCRQHLGTEEENVQCAAERCCQ